MYSKSSPQQPFNYDNRLDFSNLFPSLEDRVQIMTPYFTRSIFVLTPSKRDNISKNIYKLLSIYDNLVRRTPASYVRCLCSILTKEPVLYYTPIVTSLNSHWGRQKLSTTSLRDPDKLLLHLHLSIFSYELFLLRNPGFLNIE